MDLRRGVFDGRVPGWHDEFAAEHGVLMLDDALVLEHLENPQPPEAPDPLDSS